MAKRSETPVIVLGVGRVGRAFLKQLVQARPVLADRYEVALRPVVLADTQGALLAPGGLDWAVIDAAVQAKEAGQRLNGQPGYAAGQSALELVQQAIEQGVEGAIVVDLSAAPGMEPALTAALDGGYSVVLANKRPLAGPWETAKTFFNHPRMRFEATVGGGLPVVGTLRYLVDTGDRVHRIEGALSGTLGYLCSRLEDGEFFSAAVKTAKERGYTEPDPREDLCGNDVARKVLILARQAGWPMEFSDLQVEPLYPAEMEGISVGEFLATLPRLDSDFAAYMGALAGVPRYLAEASPQGGVVSLRMVGERLAAQLRGTLNQVSLWTDRYADMPLTISGPGSGGETSASAVLQDCLELAQSQ